MTRAELNFTLESVLSREEIGAMVFFLLQDNDSLIIKKADLDESLQPMILNQYREYINNNIINNDDISLLDLSCADDRANVLYRYDFEELPSGFEALDSVIRNEDIPTFSFSTDSLSNLKAFIILIGNNENQLVLYKHCYPVNLLKRDSVLRIVKADQRFVKLEEDVLNISDKFEFFKIGNEYFILNLTTLERIFNFQEVIAQKAREGIIKITMKDLLVNPSELEELLEDKSLSRKLIKISTESPVLIDNIPNDEVIGFTKSHIHLKNKFQYSSDGSKIHLHTKLSKKLFLKVLDDAYLLSQLTHRNYESVAKNKLTD